MILDPTTDQHCLGQLTRIARELVPTTLVQTVAARLRTQGNVIAWLQSLPQSADDGEEQYRAIACDIPQRTRLLPDDPNCFERAFGALALLEAIDPRTTRMLVTIDRPLRHTGVVERRGRYWVALDLFPRRNAGAETGKDILQGIHKYIGKPVLTFYGLGKVADQLGDVEDSAIGRAKKQPAPSAPEGAESRASTTTTQPKGGPSNEEKESTRAGASEAGASTSGASTRTVDASASQTVAREEASKRWGWG